MDRIGLYSVSLFTDDRVRPGDVIDGDILDGDVVCTDPVATRTTIKAACGVCHRRNSPGR